MGITCSRGGFKDKKVMMQKNIRRQGRITAKKKNIGHDDPEMMKVQYRSTPITFKKRLCCFPSGGVVEQE